VEKYCTAGYGTDENTGFVYFVFFERTRRTRANDSYVETVKHLINKVQHLNFDKHENLYLLMIGAA